MKWIFAFVALTLFSSCTTKPWMVGSYNDVGCLFTKKGMGKYKYPSEIIVEEHVQHTTTSGKNWGGKSHSNVNPAR